MSPPRSSPTMSVVLLARPAASKDLSAPCRRTWFIGATRPELVPFNGPLRDPRITSPCRFSAAAGSLETRPGSFAENTCFQRGAELAEVPILQTLQVQWYAQQANQAPYRAQQLLAFSDQRATAEDFLNLGQAGARGQTFEMVPQLQPGPVIFHLAPFFICITIEV